MHPTSVLPYNELTLRSPGGTLVIYCDKCQQYCVYEGVSKTCIALAQMEELYFYSFLVFIPEFNSYITA